jgi:nucleotide-binding universal stress UspA family protein
MFRSILLPISDGPHWTSAEEYALWLARKGGSRVHGLSLIDVKAYELPVLGTADGFMPSVVAPPVAETRQLLEDLTAGAEERLIQFRAVCAGRGIQCSTDLQTGIPGELICREAVAHDMVVMTRSGYHRLAGEERVDGIVQTVIRGSVRPVLVAGSSFREVQHILVAFDGSIHAARALSVAADLGSRPGVRTTLVNIAASEEAGNDTLLPAEAFLYHHDVTPQKRIVLGSKPSELICELVVSAGADLLVMGAYGHRPIREMLFGSTTERVLSHCGSTVILQS